jgi:nucleotide-binding universal stress UspA family protein
LSDLRRLRALQRKAAEARLAAAEAAVARAVMRRRRLDAPGVVPSAPATALALAMTAAAHGRLATALRLLDGQADQAAAAAARQRQALARADRLDEAAQRADAATRERAQTGTTLAPVSGPCRFTSPHS